MVRYAKNESYRTIVTMSKVKKEINSNSHIIKYLRDISAHCEKYRDFLSTKCSFTIYTGVI